MYNIENMARDLAFEIHLGGDRFGERFCSGGADVLFLCGAYGRTVAGRYRDGRSAWAGG